MKNEKKEELTAKEAGKKGGTATLKKHGRKHFVKAANARWAKRPHKAVSSA